MKCNRLVVIISVLIAAVASVVLFSLRPLGYTVMQEEIPQTEAAPPQNPLTEIALWDMQYPAVFDKSLVNIDGQIVDIYRIINADDQSADRQGTVHIRRTDGCILSFLNLHPIHDGKTIDFADTEPNESRRNLLEEQLSPYCDFSGYDTFEVFHAAPHGTAGEYLWSVSDESHMLSVTVTEDGYIERYSYNDNVPAPNERLSLNEEDCQRLIRRALRRDGMLSPFRRYTVTLTCKHMIYFDDAAIFCIARVVDEDGFVFLKGYTIIQQ